MHRESALKLAKEAGLEVVNTMPWNTAPGAVDSTAHVDIWIDAKLSPALIRAIPSWVWHWYHLLCVKLVT